jgi:hypothetical protein
MKPNKYRHLVKPLNWTDGPAGLYPGKLFWMEGADDMEGFNGSFSFTYVTKDGTLMPQDGMLVHPFDAILAFVGLDRKDILDLHATISIEIGKEREVYTFNESVIVTLPKGTQYGNIKVSGLTAPGFAEYSIYLAPKYEALEIPAADLDEPIPGGKYKDYVKPYVWSVDEAGKIKADKIGAIGVEDNEAGDGSGAGYERRADERGVAHPHDAEGPGGIGPGNAEDMLWALGEDMHDFELNTLWGHYARPGIWHRGGESHSHPNEELLITVGLDPNDPLHVGAEVELSMGEEDERYSSEVPTVWIVPKNLPHTPEITRWVDRPYGFTVVSLDGMHASKWTAKDE